MKLSKRTAKQIASLVNGIMVARKLAYDAAASKDEESQYLWLAAAARDTVKLADEFGIELPALTMERINQDIYTRRWKGMYDQRTLVG